MYQQCEGRLIMEPGRNEHAYHCVRPKNHEGECEVQVPMWMMASGEHKKPEPRFRLAFSQSLTPLCGHEGRQAYDIKDASNLFINTPTLRRVGCSECATKIVKILNEGQ